MKKKLTAATRPGELAAAQTTAVAKAIKVLCPDVEIEIKEFVSEGDRDRNTALWELKNSGFFTSRLEKAILDGDADFAVHSYKDLPTAQPAQLKIAAVCDRRYVQDCLVAKNEIHSIEQLPTGARIGTSSLRRSVQLKRLPGELKPVSIRGNVPTRLEKLKAGQFDAVVLARAGLERLNLAGQISVCFQPREFIPAPAQGAMAVQIRADDELTDKIISKINDENAAITTATERQFLITTGCGCSAPVGAFAEIIADVIELCGFISDSDGKNFIKDKIKGPVSNYRELAEKLACRLLKD